MRYTTGVILGLLVAQGSGIGADNQLSPAEIADGWILLFDGQTTFGWQKGSNANWHVENGVITVDSGEPGLLCTTTSFANYTLKLDFRAPADTNSGVFLRTPIKPKDPKTDCYELNIAEPAVSPFFTGSFVGRKKADPTPYSADWRTFEATLDGQTTRVAIDGKPVLEFSEPTTLVKGLVGLQLNKGRVEFRNIKLKPLALAPLFNHKDLHGWRVIPGKKSEFSVSSDGNLEIHNGPGALESEAQFANFVLQADIRTNGKGLNSGIFFRALPGEFWKGYESQIHNVFKENDPTKPVDFGTGAIYRRTPARKIVAKDGEWFTKTLIADGDHLAVWVNGYQVTDWTDRRPENANPREGLRRAAGVLQLQGHDPTTNLSFRKIRAVETP